MIATACRRNGVHGAATIKRVAIYVRQSVADDLVFNSIQAQREAVEAYVLSQKSQGWQVLPQHYDDHGFSGGTMDRPAFRKILEDVQAGLIDVVAVHRLDRLSRSINDFVRIMETFTRAGVAFVSTTQSFDTSTSLGRMTVNLLATFATYERDMIRERTAEKIAATRRKGLWTGGPVPPGYRIENKHLVVVPEDAERVRAIFEYFRGCGSLVATLAELSRRGWNTKAGKPFDKAGLYRLLKNPIYRGQMPLHGEVYDGVHEAIVPIELWDAVQARMKSPVKKVAVRRSRSAALLVGLIRCGTCGSAMSPHYTSRANRRWGCYVCQKAQKMGAASCPGSRIAAPKLEAFVLDRLKAIGRDPKLLRAMPDAMAVATEARKAELESLVAPLEAEVGKLTADRQGLLEAVARGGPGSDVVLARLAEVDAALKDATAKAQAARDELLSLDHQAVDERDLRKALAAFDGVWDQLFPAEKTRIVRLLVEQVRYHAKDGEVEILYRDNGLKSLLQAEVTA